MSRFKEIRAKIGIDLANQKGTKEVMEAFERRAREEKKVHSAKCRSSADKT